MPKVFLSEPVALICFLNFDDFVKSRESLENVIPAKAGIQ